MKSWKRWAKHWCGLVIAGMTTVGIAAGCGPKPEPPGPRFGSSPPGDEISLYHLAIHPLHNPSKLLQTYQPLADYINARLKGAHLVIEASRDYAGFEEKYHSRRPEFLLPNPWQTLEAMRVGYHVLAMAGEPQDFKGLLIVRTNSGIAQPSDLAGKSVSYPSPTALAACIMPQVFLHQHGINVTRDLDNRYVGSQESSIMNVYLGQTAAGATWPPPWRAFQKDHPTEAHELRVAWETESLVNNSVMVRDDVLPELQDQIRALLLDLGNSEEGRAILSGIETARFLPAADEDYEVVRTYIARFEQEIRPVKLP